ncbi:hypothetical protein [Anaerotignum sp. MB30-C6]|uniref:hypothetical protein n=1 Tax=Anaerotignum sp. MB30-C6 TaxID=3070814 RepID=UPI0027DD4807|nr:hypothetical protein [Anaerotignum sp. MB30-C6]WMI81904.1 hypothetical protein RBQ60_04015 [Anaerotignum sp. MB30-C6]
MSNEEAKLISRNTHRRMSRQKRSKLLQAFEIMLLRLINIVAVAIFAAWSEYILFHRPVLKWILILAFAVVFTDLIKSIEKSVKKSPRNGHSDRDTDK